MFRTVFEQREYKFANLSNDKNGKWEYATLQINPTKLEERIEACAQMQFFRIENET